MICEFKRAVLLFNLLAGTLVGWAQTAPIFINNSPMVAPPDIPPQIDATAFVNRSLFSVDINDVFIGSGNFNPTTIPYEAANNLYFTNTSSGVMFGDPGFRFNFATNNQRLKMDTWMNRGTITADSTFFFFNSGEAANWLVVEATNIISSGQLGVGSQGLLRLNGADVDLKRSGLRAGNALTNNGFGFFSGIGSSNYNNDVGIFDLYWGAGINNTLDGSGNAMQLDGFFFNDPSFDLPFPQSPAFEVFDQSFFGSLFTNTVQIPSFIGFNNRYDAVALTNQVGPNNFVVQVVFFPTNSVDPDFSRSVRFIDEFDRGASVVVGFHSSDFDIVSQTRFTNSVYLVDTLAFETNVFLANNRSDPTQRPNTMAVTRIPPFFSFFGTSGGNTTYTNTLLYDPSLHESNIVGVTYTGYQAEIRAVNTPGFGAISDPTNFPGRVEIRGDVVNLDQTRVRADSTFLLRAKSLTSNKLAQVDAPFIVYDVGSEEPLLVVTNVAPNFVRRLSGTVSAWSGTWTNLATNAITTNLVEFHMLIVEDNLTSLQPVLVNELRITATNNLELGDSVSVGNVLELDMIGLDLVADLSLPVGSNWSDSNIRNLINFTNRGNLVVDGSADYGTDREAPYRNLVNEGTMSAAAQFVRTENFDNSGLLLASSGLLSVQALQAKLAGGPTLIFTNVFTNSFFGFTNVFTNVITNSIGATLAGNGDVILSAEDLILSNAVIEAGLVNPGRVRLDVTNSLVDSGLDAPSRLEFTAGISFTRRPVTSDLISTELRSSVAPFAEAIIVWPGENRGADADGFQNNLGVGRLVLDAGNAISLTRFTGVGTNDAMYIDFLQFDNWTTNINTALAIDNNITVYFAGSNLDPEKLDGAINGRLRWVPYAAGPQSGTNLTYGSGMTFTFNRALVTSKDRDDDNDGIVNFLDPEPILVPVLTVTFTNAPVEQFILSWDAAAFQTQRVQFRTSLTDSDSAWQELTSFLSGPVNTQLQFADPITTNATEKYYRIRVNVP